MPIEVTDYARKLLEDLPQQFLEKPRIEALHHALGRQLQQVQDFYGQLMTLRSLAQAEGVQLDGVGDIVQLPRGGLDDAAYRDYLYYKIFKNTNTTTYYDIMRSLRMFWELPLYYSEDPAYPATILIDTASLPAEVDLDRLMTAPVIKAAGVGVHINPMIDAGALNAYSGFVTEMAYIYQVEG